MGWAGLAVPHFLPEILPAVEVGWRLAEAYRGQGLATEAGSAAVDWGFTEGGLERIVSIYEPENAPSGRVMERLGFTYERTTSGTPRGETVRVMELTRERWSDLRRRAHG
jgi:RimJ/RimL family protein N-acetyltransferase